MLATRIATVLLQRLQIYLHDEDAAATIGRLV